MSWVIWLAAAGLVISNDPELIAVGLATRYDPGVMDQVLEKRQEWGQVDLTADVSGYVALVDCDRIGQVVWLRFPTDEIDRVMVGDCATDRHRQALRDRGLAVELDYDLAVRRGVVDAPLDGVQVWDNYPRISIKGGIVCD